MSRSSKPPRRVDRLVVTTEEAAEMLAVSERTVTRMLDAGTLRGIRLRGTRRVVVASIYEAINAAAEHSRIDKA